MKYFELSFFKLCILRLMNNKAIEKNCYFISEVSFIFSNIKHKTNIKINLI
jgi:hypothetical protein